MTISPLKWIDSLHKDSSKGFQLFAVVRQATHLAGGIILARSFLTVEEIGTYEMWIYLGLIFTFFCVSGALQAMTSYYYKVEEDARPSVIWHVFVYVLSGSFILAFIMFLGRGYLLPLLLNLDDLPHYNLVIGFLFLHLSSSMTPYIFLVRGLSQYFMRFSWGYAIGYTGALLVPILLGYGLEGIIWGLFAFAILEIMCLFYFLLSYAKPVWDLEIWKGFIGIAVPLTLYGGIAILAQFFDAWLVTWQYESKAMFAIFKYGARELPGTLALAGAFSTAMIAVFAASRKNGLVRIRQGSTRLMHIFFPISIGLILLSPLLFPLVYNQEFYQSAFIFNTYLLLVISRWLFPQSILIAMDDHRALLGVSILELILNIGFSLYLIQHLGLIGVALGTVIAFIVEKIVLALVLHRRHNIRWSEYVPIRPMILYTVILMISYWLSYKVYTYDWIA